MKTPRMLLSRVRSRPITACVGRWALGDGFRLMNSRR
jgi:hypothetical protein